MTSQFEPDRWYPIASVSDLRDRHVFHASLGGQEMAVWRDDHGALNAWENRCPHRGVRLSLGSNMGSTLRCQYHGWTYESGSGTCTYVPAHRTSSNPSNACVTTFPVRERDGIVWSALGTPAADIHDLAEAMHQVQNLRSLVFSVSPATLEAALLEKSTTFEGVLSGNIAADQIRPGVVRLSTSAGPESILFYIQPVADGRSATHALLTSTGTAPISVRLRFAKALVAMRRQLEKKVAASAPVKASVIPIHAIPAPAPSAQVAAPPKKASSTDFKCKVVARSQEGVDVASFRLVPIDRPMPSLTAGMHINVHTPGGVMRQYSVVNRPDEPDGFVIGVKLEAASRGGSRSMHESVQVGAELTVSVPRNGFPLRASGKRPTLIAGGIGITPILSMAQALAHSSLPYTAHYFVRSPKHVPFGDRLKALGGSLNLYSALDVQATLAQLGELMEALDPGQDEIYTCGPLPLIEAVTQLASKRGFPDDSIRFELFKNEDSAVDGLEFEVQLARSGKTFKVPAGKTVVKACAEHGVEIETSCEQGVCGTCMVPVLSGELDHHDAYLSKAERSSGRWIMPCVSRAKSGTLVLDL